MSKINSSVLFVLFFISAGLVSCSQNKTVCVENVGEPTQVVELSDLIKFTPVPESNNQPKAVEIGGRIISVDKLVNYPICNDTWSGTVYVNCDAVVAIAEFDEDENPLFFKGCNLKIEPKTIVYVAAHNDTAYYKGCSCHTGEDPIP